MEGPATSGEAKLIELGGTLEFRDLLKFQYSQCYRRTWWLVLLMIAISFFGVLLVGILAVLNSDLEFARTTGTPFLLLFAFWIALAAAPYRGARRQLKTNISLANPITTTFSSEGIHRTGSHFSGDLSYQALWEVCETRSLFLLYTGAGSALLLPKRFFRDAAQENDWRVFVERQIAPKRISKAGFLGRRL